jgi:polygalacturonase
MKNIKFILLIIQFSLIAGFIQAQTINKIISELKWVKEVGAKSFPDKTIVFNVNDYGALGDGKTLNTRAIQSAIDACFRKGGGIVVFSPGNYLMGSIYLKKNVHLRIDKGVQFLGSQNLDDYPEIDTRIAGIEMKWPSALINVIGQQNVAVTGEGTIHAQGKPFWIKYWIMRKDYEKKGLRWIIDYDCKRPRTLLISESSDVTIRGLTMKQAGFWTVQILYSKYITVNGIIIQNNVDGSGPSTDGIDIDSSSFILVENCDIDCNDDDFCLKSGRDADGLRVNRPTEFVLIRNCISRAGGGLITLGSETSGGIRNVLAQNLKAKGTKVGIRIKSAITRGGTVENFFVRDVEMDSIGVAFEVTMNWNPSYSYSALPKGYSMDSIPVHWKTMLKKVDPGLGLPHFKNVYLTNIKVTNVKNAISAEGMKESLLENFYLENVTINSVKAGNINFAKDWKLINVKISSKDNTKIKVENSSGINL